MKIIPAIDLRDGKCVRLLQGDFDQTTEYSADPSAIARRFSTLDVDDLHIVDLDGARTGTQVNRGIVAAIAAESGLAIQLGGGIRDRDTIAQWLAAGVGRCVVGSVAIREPETVKSWLTDFGSDNIVLALDIRFNAGGIPMLTTHGWTADTDISLWACLDTYRDAGAEHVLCTDVSRDGAMAGPNLDLYGDILERYPGIGLQASGGVRHVADLRELDALRVPAAITGRALLDGKITVAEVASFRQNA